MIDIPKNWDGVTVDQYCELVNLNKEDFESEIDFKIEQLAILCNTTFDDEEIQSLDYDLFVKYLEEINFIYYPIKQKNKKYILNNKFKAIEFNNIKVGEFIDIEFFIQDGLNKNITKIFSILYKRIRKNEFDDEIIEGYNYSLEERKDLFLDLKITDVYFILEEFYKFKEQFLETYKVFFQEGLDDEEEIEDLDSIKDPILLEEIKKDIEQEKKEKKWGWEKFLFKLADGDMEKMLKITELELIYVFNYLSLKKDLGL